MTPRGIRDHNDPPDTSGLPAFDAAVGGILAGDNIVWHVACIEDYSAFVLPLSRPRCVTGAA
jgi:hypothetical protein